MDILAKELEMIARVVIAGDLRGLEDEDEGSSGIYYRRCSFGGGSWFGQGISHMVDRCA